MEVMSQQSVRWLHFLPDALYYDYGYPMQALKICPVNKRFAEDLTHRDYLGAIMNLGTSRTKIGDIIQTDDGAIVFVKEEISDYIMKNLTRIRHTTITVGTQRTFRYFL